MLHLIGRRVTLSVPLLLVASLFTFLLEFLVPGDAAAVVLAGSNATPADVEAMRHRLGLDRPLWQQYADWVGQALHGDLGRSLATNLPVTEQLNGRLGVTLSLMVGVLLVRGGGDPGADLPPQRDRSAADGRVLSWWSMDGRRHREP